MQKRNPRLKRQSDQCHTVRAGLEPAVNYTTVLYWVVYNDSLRTALSVLGQSRESYSRPEALLREGLCSGP